MARSKVRLTGFARLFIALIFIVPIAFLGASYINGTDPMTTLKDAFGMETTTPIKETIPETTTNVPPPPPMEKAGEDAETVQELRNQLNQMYDENTALKDEVERLKKVIEQIQVEQ
mgnify:CR=1 FL=1